MHLAFLQFGDFAEGWRRWKAGGPETYREQFRSLALVETLSRTHRITVLVFGQPPGETWLSDRVVARGLDLALFTGRRAFRAMAGPLGIDLMVTRAASPAALAWASGAGVPVLPFLADIFARGGLRAWWRNRDLARLFQSPVFPCIGNHSLNASRSLHQVLGLDKARILPWDRAPLPACGAAKTAPGTTRPARLFYAGALDPAKGVGDALEAVARLNAREVPVRLRLAGKGDPAPFAAEAADLGIAAEVDFLGLIGNDAARAEMAAADLVLVPSRHDYAEGLPNTLCEALAAHTPVIASDHPSFASRLKDGDSCAMFAGGDPAALAAAIARVLGDPALYGRLSANGPTSEAGLYVGMKWFDMITRFVDDPQNRTGWTVGHTLDQVEARLA